MIKGMVLYKKSSGTKLLYSDTRDNVIYGVVQDVSGKTYPEKSVQAIISKGYWDAVYLVNDDMEKHQDHDQSSHGSWATGYKPASLDDLPDLDGFSRDVFDAKYSYMFKGYDWMNGFLRDGYIDDKLETGINNEILAKEEGIKQIATLRNALYSVRTKQDFMVTRVQRTGESITEKKISEMTDKDIADLELKSYVAKGFTSTFAPESVNPNIKRGYEAQTQVLLNIMMPEGTYGATIGNNRESEFVLPPDTSFIVTSAKRVGTDKLSIDLVVSEQNPDG
jgi:hypothetical protein